MRAFDDNPVSFKEMFVQESYKYFVNKTKIVLLTRDRVITEPKSDKKKLYWGFLVWVNGRSNLFDEFVTKYNRCLGWEIWDRLEENNSIVVQFVSHVLL